jgi:soluble lytic murein transglycosylase
VYGLLQSHEDIPRSGFWYSPIFDSLSKPPAPVAKDTMVERTRGYLASRDWPHLDSLLTPLLASEGRSGMCAFLDTLVRDSAADTVRPTPRLFDIAKALKNCGKNDAAIRCLDMMKRRKDFSTAVSEKSFAYLSAELQFLQGNYKKAIDEYKKIEKKYGPASDVLIAIAKAYRKLDQQDDAVKWYSRHLALYPASSLSQDILWYKGWVEEENEEYDSARTSYRKFHSRFGSASRAEEVYVRVGLCYYKEEKYVPAVTTFNAFARSHPQSNQLPAALYWKGKCQVELKRYNDAKETFADLAGMKPTEYYSFRAREMLKVLGDTILADFAFDALLDIAAARAWLDSISRDSVPAAALTGADSVACKRGVMLAVLGQVDIADCFIKPIERQYPSNLTLQFDLSLLFSICDAPAQSYRIGRRLTWRIPAECQREMPLPLYALLYPLSYNEAICREAAKNKMESSLISGLIRQESIFDSKIVSPVGAVGLMQIMPSTGAGIARNLGEPFAADSLLNPALNIRYGCFYLRRLMDEFDQNVILALAGYNGGPQNVKRWYARNHKRALDIFIEDIGFSETRKYVKLVLANYWTYLRLRRTFEIAFANGRGNALASLPQEPEPREQ